MALSTLSGVVQQYIKVTTPANLFLMADDVLQEGFEQ
jgi:hypothetical protein